MHWTSEEVTAAIAAGAALLGSAIAGIITFSVTRSQVKSAENIAADQRRHESDLAQEARHQERKIDACMMAVRMMSVGSEWFAWKLRELKDPGKLKQPTEPSDLDGDVVTAAATLFMSEDSFHALVAWLFARDATYDTIHTFETPGTGVTMSDVESAYQSCFAAARKANEAFRQELLLLPKPDPVHYVYVPQMRSSWPWPW